MVKYVDNVIITDSEESGIKQIKFKMNKDFDMTYLGLLNYCLDVEVWKTGSNIFVPKTKYGKIFLDKFRMRDCKLSSTPMEKGLKLSARTNSKEINESVYKQLVGNLIYLTTTRPDLSFIISSNSILMTTPKVEN